MWTLVFLNRICVVFVLIEKLTIFLRYLSFGALFCYLCFIF